MRVLSSAWLDASRCYMVQDKASQAYDSTTQAAHDATREPTTFEKAKGYMSPPSTADKVKAGAADAYANAKVLPPPLLL